VFSINSPRSDLCCDQDDSLGHGRGESAWCNTCCQPFTIVAQVPHQCAELDLSEEELQSRVSSGTTRAADLLHHTPGVGVSPAPHIRNEGWNTLLQYSFMRSTFRCDTVNILRITYSVAAYAPFGRVYPGARIPTVRLLNHSPVHILCRCRIRLLYPSCT
jgi:hypothetical protein